MTSFSKFSDALPAFTCTSTIGNLQSICLGVNILCCLQSETLAMQATLSKILVNFLPCFPFGNIPPSKALRMCCLPLKSIIASLRVTALFSFFL